MASSSFNLDPKNFLNGAVSKKGVISEPLLVNGTVGLGGPEAKDFTRVVGPCVINGTLHAERVRFERGLQIQGNATLIDVKVEGPCATAGKLLAKDTSFQGDLYCGPGNIFLEKSRALDLRVEAPVFKYKFLSYLFRWVGRTKVFLDRSTIRDVRVAPGAKVQIVLMKGSSQLGRMIGNGNVKDKRNSKSLWSFFQKKK